MVYSFGALLTKGKQLGSHIAKADMSSEVPARALPRDQRSTVKNPAKRIGLLFSLVVTLLLTVGAAPAAAKPESCYIFQYIAQQHVHGGCWAGTGEFKIWAQCHEPWGHVHRESAWVAAGFPNAADVRCAGSLYRYGMVKRN
jgi:hypothetical protein